MRILPLSVLLAAATVVPAGATLQDALITQRLLADIADAQVVKLERGDSASPATRYGVAFAFERCLWIYTAEAGTRVLGPGERNLPDSAQITAALQRYDPAVYRVTVYRHPTSPAVLGDQWELNRACVVSSLLALGELLQAGDDAQAAGLILLSYASPKDDLATGMSVDHCVLVVRNRQQQWRTIDPAVSKKSYPLARLAVGEPVDDSLLDLLRTDYPLQSARLLPIEASTLQRIAASTLWRAFSADRLHGSTGVRLP